MPGGGYIVPLLTESEGYIDNYTTSAEGTSGIISICLEDEVSKVVLYTDIITRTLGTILKLSITSF